MECLERGLCSCLGRPLRTVDGGFVFAFHAEVNRAKTVAASKYIWSFSRMFSDNQTADVMPALEGLSPQRMWEGSFRRLSSIMFLNNCLGGCANQYDLAQYLKLQCNCQCAELLAELPSCCKKFCQFFATLLTEI